MRDGGDGDLVLLNVGGGTLGPGRARGGGVLVVGGRVVGVGDGGEVRRMAGAGVRVVDCAGLTLLPGFNDAHCHLPGLARRLQDLDCSPGALLGASGVGGASLEALRGRASLEALRAAVRGRALGLARGAWVRGFGYDDLGMVEGRHPSRWDLDLAAPEHPVWLEHRSGHAAALNSLALGLAGIGWDTPDPPGGLIERDGATGEPTGALLEMRSFLRRRLGNIRSRGDFDAGMREVGSLLSGYGITSAQDAGADNGPERWDDFRRLQAEGALRCRVTMMAGAERLGEFAALGMSFGSGDGWLRLGHAKIMLTMTAGGLYPPVGELRRMVREAHTLGFPVAMHCVEEAAVAAAAGVLGSERVGGLLDRLEHCAEAPPYLVAAVRRSGAAVVTQPGFLYHRGAAYRREVDAGLLPHLYPAGALRRAGVVVAFGSDAPVIDPNPWPGIYSAVTGCAGDGVSVRGDGGDDWVGGVGAALGMYSVGGALVEGLGGSKGGIAPGMWGDLVLVDGDPLSVGAGGLLGVGAVMTVVGGVVVWTT